LEIGNDRLVGDDEFRGIGHAGDGAFEALFEIGDQVSGRSRRKIFVAALAAEDHLARALDQAGDHVLGEGARPGDGKIEVVR